MPAALPDDAATRARALVTQRDALERQIKEVNEALLAQKGVGMHGRLVDDEGFPRGDIDVYQVRTLRHEMARLLYDHRQLTRDIEAALADVHASASQRGAPPTGAQPPVLPFARIEDVSAGSPADRAGLKKGDLVVRFGHVDAGNHRELKALAELTAASEGTELLVVVQRAGAGNVDIMLTPGKWAGRGLLGCHVVPHHMTAA
eukprot:Unigene861_Nuclearia_a/m.2770 Unigene861_Nuclearia_a/g.2770  ORF Unigene861_Nuclearia_a/g.2770 Unigene861_Nuclearia_a/m.2770 type:complete len:203 (-) Unigene861_Nuclearia_a:21-629(-)